MSEEKVNRVGVMFLGDRAYREVDGQKYLLDKYGMASTLELEWWQTPSGEAEDRRTCGRFCTWRSSTGRTTGTAKPIGF